MSYVRTFCTATLLALNFLTRLGRPRITSLSEMQAAVSYFPIAGAILSAFLLAPFVVFQLYASLPLIQAVLYASAYAWSTRALHHDGLADLCDALGSGKRGEEFYRILKDSRTGAFGVTGLALFIAGQVCILFILFSFRLYALLFFIPIASRSLVILFAHLAPANNRTGLGNIMAAASQKKAATLALASCAIYALIFFGFAATVTCIIFHAAGLLWLIRLSSLTGGYNGDFLGCYILLAELLTPLAVVLFL